MNWANKGSLLVMALVFASSAGAEEYLVKLKPNRTLSQFLASGRTHAFSAVDYHDQAKLVKVSADDQAAASLKKRSDVEYVVKNVKRKAYDLPNDPRLSDQWMHGVLRSDAAWNVTSGSHGVVVAVIDTGVDVAHADLAANIWVNANEVAGNGVDDDHNGFVDDVNGWDFKNNDRDPTDETGWQNPGHGTHVSGIVGAVGGNGLGVVGVNQQVSIMALRFLGSDGSGDDFDAIKAIDYAVANGAHVINASWGGSSTPEEARPLREAIDRANQAGVIFVAAAGNDSANNDEVDSYPADIDLPNVISVAASNSSDGKPYWSNYGAKTVHLAAPGDGILSTIPGGAYSEMSGTSMASPVVAGLVALVKSIDLEISGPQVLAVLSSTGASVNIETVCNCRVDSAAAVEAVSTNALVVVPQVASLSEGDSFEFSAYGGQGGYAFRSSNEEVATVTENGELVAHKGGEVKVIVSDSAGNEATSRTLVIQGSNKDPDDGDDGDDDDDDAQCPYSSEFFCWISCWFDDHPWC